MPIDSPTLLDASLPEDAAHGSRLAVHHKRDSFTYRQLDSVAESTKAELLEAGVGVGQVVAILVDDSPYWLAPILAALRAGAAVLPLNPGNVTETLGLLERVRPPFVLGAEEVIQLPGLRQAWSSEYVAAARPRHQREVALHPDVAYLAPTSGTTGSPNLVLGSRRGLSAFLAAELDLLGPRPWVVGRLTPPTFDVFWRDILVPICAGGMLSLLPTLEMRLDPGRLAAWIDSTGVEVLHCVPTILRALGTQLPRWRPAQLRWLLVAGEPLFSSDVRPWLEASDVSVVNVYGTSETTLAKYFHVVSRDDLAHESVPVGRCIPGAAGIVLDEEMRPCPHGKPGEVYIATAHPLHGYFDDPERTRTRFVRNPVGDDGALVDRTGDIGRFRPDGVLELLGRANDSVKVAGTRVALDAIEGRLREHHEVTDCHVALFRGQDNEAYVIVFVALAAQSMVNVASLGQWLMDSGCVPASVPLRFELVPRIPRTDRGKVARRVLLSEVDQATLRHLAPRSSSEKLVHQIWHDVLPGAPRFGVLDNFSFLGGQSVHAAQIVARLEQATGIRIALRDFLALGTVEAIGQALDTQCPISSNGAPGDAVARLTGRFLERSGMEPIPLSYAQRRFWKMMARPDASTLHYLWLACIQGPLDLERLGNAVRLVAAHQPATRTIVELLAADRDDPTVATLPPDRVVLDLPPASGADLEEATDVARAWALRPFELSSEPPARMCVAPLGPDRHLFGLAGHVIVSDGTSKDLLLQNLAQAYADGVIAPPLRHTFDNYALWERSTGASKAFERHVPYWEGRLPADLPRPSLPYSSGSALSAPAGGATTLQIDADRRVALRRAGSRHGASESAALLAAFTLALGSWSPDSALPILVPHFNRLFSEEQRVAGCWTETGITYLPTGGTVRDALLAASEAVRGVLDHMVPLDWLLARLYPSRDTSAPETFPIMFAPQPDLGQALQLPGCEVVEVGGTADLQQAVFPIHVLPVLVGDCVSLTIAYDRNRFGVRTIETLASSLDEAVLRITAYGARETQVSFAGRRSAAS